MAFWAAPLTLTTHHGTGLWNARFLKQVHETILILLENAEPIQLLLQLESLGSVFLRLREKFFDVFALDGSQPRLLGGFGFIALLLLRCCLCSIGFFQASQ